MSEVEHKLDQLFCNAFSTHHPAMIDWVRVKFELKTLRAQLAEAQKEVYPAYKREKALRYKAEAENAELKTEIERRNSKTWCAYCGFEIDIDDEASTKISEHIMSCPKHPIRIYERHSEALEAENAELRARLKQVEEVYQEFNTPENEKDGFDEECKDVFWQAIKAACERK